MFGSFGMGVSDEAGFDLVICGDNASFRSYGIYERCICAFQPPSYRISSSPQEFGCLGV